MAFNFTVQISDPNNLPQDAALVTDVVAAANSWSQFLVGFGSINIQINVFPTTRANSSAATFVNVGTDAGRTVQESGTTYELLTGTDPNGVAADLNINVDPTYLQNQLWLDPNPNNPSAIPSNRTDALSVMLHELGHSWGIISFLDPNTGTFSNRETTWDQLLRTASNGGTVFVGGWAEYVYGGDVPVTTLKNGEQYSHLGNSASDPIVGQDLMNGVSFSNGTAYRISALDVAILEDVGVPIAPSFNSGLITYRSMYNIVPSTNELPVLVRFGTNQLAYGQLIGVLDPSVYMYQAFGQALSEGSDTGATTFKNQWGPPAIASDVSFVSTAYSNVFGVSGTSGQIQHFIDQVNFFKTIYTASGAFGANAARIDLLARGAIWGQMQGIEEEIRSSAVAAAPSAPTNNDTILIGSANHTMDQNHFFV